jgi:ankyrin repeat protein
VADALVANGADLAAVGTGGTTPLHAAAQEGHGGVVRALVAGGAPLEQRSEAGLTPVQLALAFGHDDAADALIGAGADPQPDAGDEVPRLTSP